MPVVLVEALGKTRSGYSYDDRSGVSYEYPVIYHKRRLIVPGDRFVYCRPKGVGYVGCGIIGQISESKKPGRLICEILSPSFFRQPIPLKDSIGSYYEAPMSKSGNVYFGQGVRAISEAVLESILGAADIISPDHEVNLPMAAGGNKTGYASSADAIAVEKYSIDVAVAWAKQEFAGKQVLEMPHNNPGFDLRVGPATDPERFIEVKGTRSLIPQFFMSEGERAFSMKEQLIYTLLVVTGIDISVNQHRRLWRLDGALSSEVVRLDPYQWHGRILPDDENDHVEPPSPEVGV